MNKLAIWLILFFHGITILPLAAQNDLQVIGSAYFSTSEVAVGAEVVFLIRFENNGTDTVQNLVIRDTLDPRFDASTLRVIDASHGYQLLRDQGFVRWYFNGIRLPNADPDFSDNSTGYILYAVRLHSFLNSSQVIQNRVCISFDETTVCTNVATVWIEGSSSFTRIPEQPVLSLSPNPNNGNFQVTFTAGARDWWITDTNGHLVQNAVVSDNQYDVHMDTAEPGMYLFWVRGQSGLQVELFAVIR
ncbi:MAG: hypothetical protein ACK5FV_13675 [Bacteroidota bacterium]|jgi:uncharacterized repeat protein (TIGR01451 family)|nr:DUF11 domain-containing protein [Saprospiraceae bacterium]